MRTSKAKHLLFMLVALGSMIATPRFLSAQDEVGALYGTVTDTEGNSLPGASLSLTGMGASKLQISDQLGQFRFLGLDPGAWSLEANLDGFSRLQYPAIKIRASRNTSIEIQLAAAIEEVISVTAESPLLDERKLEAGTRVNQVELEKIPTGRDPWALLTQAAGVLVNRVDVGGSDSDQQAIFRSQGTASWENDYVLDGVQISSGGSTTTYYDFDQFEEIQLATGGNDVTKNTMGVSISLVTKRGTNEMRGSARFFLTDDDGYFGILEQADPGWSESDLGPGQTDYVGDSIDRIQDYGLEAGGPAWRDHLWLWGSWGRREIDKVTGGGDPERFELDNEAIKVNAQLSQSNSFVGSWNNGDKQAAGRGSAPNVDASATWDQRGPTGITKIEDSHIFGSSLFLSGQYSFIDAGFQFAAQGGAGPDRPPTPLPGGEANVDANGYLTNNLTANTSQPIEEWKIDGSYFFNSGDLAHELRFGGRLREDKVSYFTSYPGRNLFHFAGNLVGVQDPGLLEAFGLPPERYSEAHLVYAYRQGAAPSIANQDSLWVQDTMTRGAWTLNAAVRYDRQDGRNEPATVEANIGFPEVMPAVSFEGDDADGITWETVSPRLGLTYAVGQTRNTLLRGSLSRFPAVLAPYYISRTNPVVGQFALILFLDDPGGYPSFYDDGEPYAVIGGALGFNPDDPTALVSSNQNDPDMRPPITTELILGVEHSFLPDLVAGMTLTWRRLDRWDDFQPLFEDLATGEVGTAGANEYRLDQEVSGLLPDGSSYRRQTFSANSSLQYTGGDLYTSGDREIDSFFTALSFAKRLSNRWMARGFVNYSFREQWVVPRSYFETNDPNRLLPGDTIDGETVAQLFAGSGAALQSGWQWNLNGMYQVAPEKAWGFNIAANLTGRQGYPIPYFRRVLGQDGILRRILIPESVTDYRYDDIFITDLRLEKEFAASGSTSLTFSIDGFNIFNQGTVLIRQTNLAANTVDWVLQTVSPRIWRLGVRLSWR
ncbi:MAG: carboxypeptidase regulatory-like domain-containing protein [Acidobacteriota bacterium]